MPPSQVPKFAVNNKSRWYTHHHTLRIVRSLDRYVKDSVLFTYLDPDIDRAQPLAATTNPLEGGINAPLKSFLHAHRGWSEEHMLTALDYWLSNRYQPSAPRNLHHQHSASPASIQPQTQLRPARRNRQRHRPRTTMGRQPHHPKRMDSKLTTRPDKTHFLSINPKTPLTWATKKTLTLYQNERPNGAGDGSRTRL